MFASNNLFESSFIQKIRRKKGERRPLFSTEMMNDSWKKQFQTASTAVTVCTFNNNQLTKTKTYNKPDMNQSKTTPSLTPSASITTTSSTSEYVMPIPSSSSPSPPLRKRPPSSEIILKMMDQRLIHYQHQNKEYILSQNDRLYSSPMVLAMSRSTSATTAMNDNDTGQTKARLNKLLSKSSLSLSTRQISPNRRQPSPGPPVKKIQSIQENECAPSLFSSVLKLDNDEQDRMVAQHYLLRTAFGTDYCSPIRSQLKSGIIVLDVGCGSGTWTMEMSTAFPKSTFIGIDPNAFYPKDIKPRNCHFRTCALLVQQEFLLPFPDNSIDYIFQRDINWGLYSQSWLLLLKEFQRILKPGGWIELVEPNIETQNRLENEYYMNNKIISGLTARQQDPYAVHRLPSMLSANGFQQVENHLVQFSLGWGTSYSNYSALSSTDIVTEEIETSSTLSEKIEPCSEFSRAIASQYLFLLQSLKPWLSSIMKLCPEKYDEYISTLPEEWKKGQTYINWHSIIAQKPHQI
ncbi:S-adenosyl-L-methionine-dependent methyltransferase [Pilobolus umbonatus]|nr:S-adenosyl-L-methionine-dependent methyltransferase [Pilobolus umbonatus]